jgi:hypothetical protein
MGPAGRCCCCPANMQGGLVSHVSPPFHPQPSSEALSRPSLVNVLHVRTWCCCCITSLAQWWGHTAHTGVMVTGGSLVSIRTIADTMVGWEVLPGRCSGFTSAHCAPLLTDGRYPSASGTASELHELLSRLASQQSDGDLKNKASAQNLVTVCPTEPDMPRAQFMWGCSQKLHGITS